MSGKLYNRKSEQKIVYFDPEGSSYYSEEEINSMLENEDWQVVSVAGSKNGFLLIMERNVSP